jgi:cation diffusion facilitator CzcD-associated flavoprotein CzcO
MSTPRIAIVGGGFSGIGMGIALRRAGIDSFTILEGGDRVGGVWARQHLSGRRL